MQTVIVFAADDGTRFDTAEEAKKHDARLHGEVVVLDYLDSCGLPVGRHRTSLRNRLTEFAHWVADKSNADDDAPSEADAASTFDTADGENAGE